MTRAELKRRLSYIAATKLKDKINPRDPGRRETGSIEPEENSAVSEHDSFFDFEEDIAELESARKQIERFEAAKAKEEASSTDDADLGAIILEEDTKNDVGSAITMEVDDSKADSPGVIKTAILEEKEKSKDGVKYDEVKGFKFKYCKYIKSNNEQCKRQAPKDGDYCGTHRKMVDKQSS